MAVEEVVKSEVKCVAEYAGHNVLASGSIDLNLKCEYGELPNYLQIVQMLNNDVKVVCKLVDEQDLKPFSLGQFRIKQIRIDHDGCANLKFNSITDFVEVNKINSLIGAGKFKVKFSAEIIMEE